MIRGNLGSQIVWVASWLKVRHLSGTAAHGMLLCLQPAASGLLLHSRQPMHRCYLLPLIRQDTSSVTFNQGHLAKAVSPLVLMHAGVIVSDYQMLHCRSLVWEFSICSTPLSRLGLEPLSLSQHCPANFS